MFACLFSKIKKYRQLKSYIFMEVFSNSMFYCYFFDICWRFFDFLILFSKYFNIFNLMEIFDVLKVIFQNIFLIFIRNFLIFFPFMNDILHFLKLFSNIFLLIQYFDDILRYYEFSIITWNIFLIFALYIFYMKELPSLIFKKRLVKISKKQEGKKNWNNSKF